MVSNGTLYFIADDGVSGEELWKTDGTDAGTVLVKDINPGAGGSGPDRLTSF
jgi:ELWxxDGT repeat protein